MNLTGKCKSDFEKWYKAQEYDRLQWCFIEMPQSMKWGVYVDFFESENIVLDVYKADLNAKKGSFVAFLNELDISVTTGIDSRPEARSLAVEKANKLYNIVQ